MIKVNFLTVFKTFKGETMRANDISRTLNTALQTIDAFLNKSIDYVGLKDAFDALVKDNPELTLRDVSLTAITNPNQGEKDGIVKFRRGLLAHRIAENDVLELPAEDITLLKQLINDAYPSPVVIWNAFSVLEPGIGEGTGKPN